MKIAVLIPCYNESRTIAKVVADYRAVLPEADIYVYDNNSTDHTDDIAREAGAIVRYEYRQGKGNVIRTMFREIEADCYLMIDGDDTYPAENAREMVDLVLNRKVDMVVGDRLSATYYTENKRPFHNLGNRLVKRLVNTIFHGDVRDIMTGYRAFSYQFVKSFPVLSQGFEIETEMTIHALDKNLSLNSVPVEYRDRPEDSVSKLNTYSDGLRVLRTIARLYKEYRPLSFFGLFAALFGAAGLILFIPVLAEYFRTGLVPRFPTLIVSGVMMTFAGFLFAFLTGAGFDLAHHGGGVVVGVLLDAADQHLAGLVLRHAGDALHFSHLPLLVVFDVLLHFLQFVLPFAQRLLAAFQGVLLFIQRFLALQDAALAALHLGPALAAFAVQLGFQAQDLFLGLKDGFLFLLVGLSLRVFQQVSCVFLGAADLFFAGLLAVQISARSTQRRRRDRYEDRYDPFHGVHSLPLVLLPAA